MYVLDEPWSDLTAVVGRTADESVVAILDPEDNVLAFLTKENALRLVAEIVSTVRQGEVAA